MRSRARSVWYAGAYQVFVPPSLEERAALTPRPEPRLRRTVAEVVVAERGPLRAIVANPDSPKSERRRAQNIARFANRELGFDFGIYSPLDLDPLRRPHAFVAIEEGFGVGILVVERRGDFVWRLTWEDFDLRREPRARREVPGPWTVVVVWVTERMRRRGVGSFLVSAAARYLGIDVSDLAWYTPFSEAGERLARRISTDQLIVAK